MGDTTAAGFRSSRLSEWLGPENLIAARLLALGILAALVLRVAWISDDSLITLRTALNLSHGWGPGFNATEAVQAYTHPLWFVLWLIGGAVSGQWIVTVVALSVACSSAAIAIVLWSARSAAAVILAAAALGFSNAFMEYAASGLENPLAYALLGALFVMSLREFPVDRSGAGRYLALGTLLAGVALTRLDLALLALPATLLIAWRCRRNVRGLLVASLGFILPLAAWFAWSFVTYHAFLPNTFEAKRNLLIPLVEILFQGFRYFWVSIDRDPVTGLVLAAGLLAGLRWGASLQRAWVGGVLLYLVYVVYIGGDFMAGRFLAVPVLIALLVALTCPTWDSRDSDLADPERQPSGSLNVSVALTAVTLVVALLVAARREPVALLNPGTQLWLYEEAAGVADERGFYLEHKRGIGQWLMSLGTVDPSAGFRAVADANAFAPLWDIQSAAKDWPRKNEHVGTIPSEVAVRCGLLGALGILSGPGVHWIDRCALTDRFLAELPYARRGLRWRVGHYLRSIPEGYIEAVASNDAHQVKDPVESQRLADLWSQIRN